METVRKSSLESTKPLEGINNDQFVMPSMGLIGVLIVALLVLKVFIYIKDSKRHGK